MPHMALKEQLTKYDNIFYLTVMSLQTCVTGMQNKIFCYSISYNED